MPDSIEKKEYGFDEGDPETREWMDAPLGPPETWCPVPRCVLPVGHEEIHKIPPLPHLIKHRCPTHPDVDSAIHWGCPDCLYALKRELEALRGQQERVRGLPEKWRMAASPGEYVPTWDAGYKTGLVECADELERVYDNADREGQAVD